MPRRAAFFDMDNTLLRVETGMSWVRLLYKRGELPPRMVAKALYWQALYKLAVLDMDTVFGKLVEKYPTLRLAVDPDDVEYRQHFVLRGLKALPVTA